MARDFFTTNRSTARARLSMLVIEPPELLETGQPSRVPLVSGRAYHLVRDGGGKKPAFPPHVHPLWAKDPKVSRLHLVVEEHASGYWHIAAPGRNATSLHLPCGETRTVGTDSVPLPPGSHLSVATSNLTIRRTIGPVPLVAPNAFDTAPPGPSRCTAPPDSAAEPAASAPSPASTTGEELVKAYASAEADSFGFVFTTPERPLPSLRKLLVRELGPTLQVAFPSGWQFSLQLGGGGGGTPIQPKQEARFAVRDVLHRRAGDECSSLTLLPQRTAAAAAADAPPFAEVGGEEVSPLAGGSGGPEASGGWRDKGAGAKRGRPRDKTGLKAPADDPRPKNAYWRFVQGREAELEAGGGAGGGAQALDKKAAQAQARA